MVRGLVEAAIRADDAIGVAQDFIDGKTQYPAITSRDSNAWRSPDQRVDADAETVAPLTSTGLWCFEGCLTDAIEGAA